MDEVVEHMAGVDGGAGAGRSVGGWQHGEVRPDGGGEGCFGCPVDGVMVGRMAVGGTAVGGGGGEKRTGGERENKAAGLEG